MKICFHGTADEISLVAGRPLLVLLTARDLPCMRVFELYHSRVHAQPHLEQYRLCARLSETTDEGRTV
ncbi:hypothetical protein FE391_14615 [Nonomuraea sp. KC401]|uniref:hypothetical protein n=1 Tax=unclassified Nonomuraea TaxID=2593643 RepID=UPI0010FD3D2F|nr:MULTISPECIES: hypothetical protein [unclassified Nonomuraea]NBE98563.1 hypothetical protein [Nonomuraea sp. K271]TLF74227.1 hypothetical protein FE391_14615 [Nonomuraea sp. KC401]